MFDVDKTKYIVLFENERENQYLIHCAEVALQDSRYVFEFNRDTLATNLPTVSHHDLNVFSKILIERASTQSVDFYRCAHLFTTRSMRKQRSVAVFIQDIGCISSYNEPAVAQVVEQRNGGFERSDIPKRPQSIHLLCRSQCRQK